MGKLLREMLISHDLNETRVAILEDRELVELYIARPKRSVVGNVYLGQVKDVLPGMQAAFIDIGLEKNAFLAVDERVALDGIEVLSKRDIRSLLHPGQTIVVQVIKDPAGTKGARVTTGITFPGRFLVLVPNADVFGASRKLGDGERARLQEIVAPHVPPNTGLIIRTAASGASERDMLADLEFLLRLWRRVSHQANEGLAPEVIYSEMDLALKLVRDVFSTDFKRLVIDDKAVHAKVTSFLKRTSPNLLNRVHLHKDSESIYAAYKVDSAIDRVFSKNIGLASGGYICIDQTEALTVVDVNTGRFTSGKNLEDTVYRTNLEAARVIAQQIRLRDIGGIIVVDFIDMKDAFHRQEVVRQLSAEFERDRNRYKIGEISKFGLLEITRKSVTDGLYAILTEQCACCNGEGRVPSVATRRITVERKLREIVSSGRSSAYLIGLHPETYELSMAPGHNLIARLRAATNRQITIIPDESCSRTEVRVLIEGKKGLPS
ncbi:MAG: Rne/Rng family ribonuclease [Actinobacteria bacterium]|nr:Rne/Rng family ribonuclease [Actinomycetota bacterium]